MPGIREVLVNRRTRTRSRLVLHGVLGALAASLTVLLGAFLYLKSELPTLRTAADYDPPRATHIYSDDGELVGELYRERRTVVPIEAVPKHVVYAFLAAEDANFYQHEGLDYLGILRAAVKNLRPGAHLQGASTITQQTVKTIVLGPERSYARKMREAILAREMEQLLTKDEILYLYLNQIYFGSGAYGVEEAARTYFAKSIRTVTLGEAALLAAMPKNPSHYTPAADPTAAKQRQIWVLEQMQANGWADPEDVQRARSEPVPLPPSPPKYLRVGPHYIEHVKNLLVEKLGEEAVLTRGFTVYVGMNARMQASAHESVRIGLENLARLHGYVGPSGRIEVDKLTRYRTLLQEAFKERARKLAAHGAKAPKAAEMIWDLGALTPAVLADESAIENALRLAPLGYGQRVTALVDKVDSVADEAWVHLGSTRVAVKLASLSWARRFSPAAATPPPRDPSDVVREGDLVLVEVLDVPAAFGSKRPLRIELVPVPKVEGALVAIDPHTRLVRALVGGYRAEAGGFNRALQAQRQPGSAFKPFVYAAGLAAAAITPAAICQDTPIVIRDPWTGVPWKPENYEDGKFDGNITYLTALMRSKNTCSVKLIEKIGPAQVIAIAKAAGIESPLPENLTLALGTGDVRPVELASGYATIAAGGLYAPPIFIRKIVDVDGTVLEETQSEPVEAMKPAVAYVLTQMMRSVVEGGTATKALVLDRPLAGKTGTSNEARNLWFAGFSAELVAAVWVGLDDNGSLGRATGGGAALPVWIDFMGRALAGVPVRELTPSPEDVVFVRIDPATGEPSDDADAVQIAFIAGSEPQKHSRNLPSIFIEDDTGGFGP